MYYATPNPATNKRQRKVSFVKRVMAFGILATDVEVAKHVIHDPQMKLAIPSCAKTRPF